MKIRQDELDSSQSGNFDSIESTIDKADLGLALKMVSENLYSNPIGSFIRELTSNAVDANVDANEDSPILIEIYSEDDTYFIEVKDKGVGMSPETFKSIYMSWFKSDKRDTDKKIGGWGLGSKSPLAYQDSFEIITRFDGIKYSYLFAKENTVPTATLMYDEPTDDTNGTSIKVEIKSYDDVWKVHQECKKQLVYFDNVYVRNELYFYDNNFKVYESELFKLRNKDFPYGNEMHICLGQVAYPIDWNTLDIERIDIPVAIKFSIEELEVTLSREELNYTDKVKEIITERIKKVSEILFKKYTEQLQIKDLFEYIKLVKDNKKPPLQIEDVSISMAESKKTITFSPLEGINLKGKDILRIFSAYNVIHLRGGKHFNKHSESIDFYYCLYRYTQRCYLVEKDTNFFDSTYIGDGYLFKRGKLTPYRFKKIALALGLIEESPKYNYFTKKSDPIIVQGAAKQVHKLLKYIDIYLKEIIQPYEGTAPEDWIAEQKSLTKEKKEKLKGEITYYNIYNNRKTIMLKELIEDYKVIFYISKDEDKERILAYHALYEKGNLTFKRKAFFIIASATVINKLTRHKNVYPVNYIFKIGSYQNLLHRLKLSKEVKSKFPRELTKCFAYSNYYATMLAKLKNEYTYDYRKMFHDIPIKGGNKDTFIIDLVEYFAKPINNVKLSNYRNTLKYEEYIDILINIRKKINMLNYISNSIPHDTLVDFIKTLKVLKLNPMYYTYLTEEN